MPLPTQKCPRCGRPLPNQSHDQTMVHDCPYCGAILVQGGVAVVPGPPAAQNVPPFDQTVQQTDSQIDQI